VTNTPQLLDLVRRLVDSWNQRDEEAFAALFAADAEYVTGQRERRRGRRAIGRLLRADQPGLTVALRGAPSAESDRGTGTVWFEWMAARPGGAARHGRITCSVARHDGHWLIQRLENDEAEAQPRQRGHHG
jgi:uncharacterized protein (TIGR02246 family)